MEVVFIGIVIIAIIVAICNNTNKKYRSSSPPPLPNPPSSINRPKPRPKSSPTGSTLQVFTRERSIEVEGIEIDTFEFSQIGIFSSTQNISRPEMVITMHVKVDGKLLPVLSVIENWQASDSNEFESRISINKPIFAGGGSLTEVVIGGVPREILGFPTTGHCQIITTLTVYDQAANNKVASVSSTHLYDVTGHGYLESFEKETILQGNMIKLALYMAGSDGRTDDEEVDVIKRWGKRMVTALPDDHQAKRKTHLNRALTEATSLIRAGAQSQGEKNAIEVLREDGDVRELYDAYELCLMVIEADGEAHPEEMALLSRLAKGLGLDEDKARALLDKSVANLKFVFSDEGGSQDKHLGITADMSKEDIRKHLGKLYRKHNARRSSDDEEVKTKAKEWLDMIAEARARHI